MPETSKPVNVENLKKLVRTVPDFPKRKRIQHESSNAT